ncbi:hypothetical protein FRC08_009549 [Ceratobasidium sp. 394]|nr:hypothetical protein FRC08_009549 [Ceratobasidium sp. 394]
MSGNMLIPEILNYITQIVQVTTDIGDQVVDTAKLGDKYKFKGFHVGFWGKMAKSGKKAPSGMHPRLFLGESSQVGPYLDRAVRMLAGNFDPTYFLHCPLRQFNDAVEFMLQPAIIKLAEQIPGLLKQHRVLWDSLNPTYQVGSAPFCMTVLNIQPATRGHRDASDQLDSICLILPLGDYRGGDLCLFEPGLCIDLRPGMFAAIRSKRDLHFNLHFEGQRFSFVFTSDLHLKRWATDRNHMRCFQSNSSEEDARDEPTDEDEGDAVA